jgi:CRP-like cAMP-binding protein
MADDNTAKTPSVTAESTEGKSNAASALLLGSKAGNKFTVPAAGGGKSNPFAAGSGASKPLGGTGKSKWMKARGRLKTSVVLNISAKKNMLKKADLLVDAGHGHHHPWGKYMIHPNNKARRAWDVITILFVLYLCWKIPLSLGFGHWYGNKSLKPFEIFMDYWFLADILLNFVTGFVHDGHLIMNPVATAHHYLEFWFWIDTFASIPFELFMQVSKKDRKAIKMVKWLKIPRLLRIGRILKQLKGYARFYKVFLAFASFLWLMHMMGCVWVSIIDPCPLDDTYAYNFEDPATTTYILKYYDLYPQGSDCADVWRMYATGLNMGAKSLLGASPPVLFGDDWTNDIDHETAGSIHVFGFFASAFGIIFTAAVFGETFVILSHKDPQGWDYFGRLDRIKKEITNYGLPEDLAHDIIQYYDYLYMNNLYGKTALLGDVDMSSSLKHRVGVALNVDVIRKIDLFRHATAPCLQFACSRLQLEIHMPYEVLITAGESNVHESLIKMYVVQRGQLDVIKGLPSRHSSKHTSGHHDAKAKHGKAWLFKKLGLVKEPEKTEEELKAEEELKQRELEETEELFGGDDEVVIATLSKGLSFGELSMIDPFFPRNNSVRTKTICEVHALCRADFKVLVESFPKFGQQIAKVAKLKKLNFKFDIYNEGKEEKLHDHDDHVEADVNEKLKYLDRQVKMILEGVRDLQAST